MDILQGYSSDEEEEDAQVLAQDHSQNPPSTQPQAHSSTLAKPFFDEFDIFSQNYQYNSTGNTMVQAFLYIPWNPSLATVNELKKISQRAIQQIKRLHPAQSDNYTWHYVGAPLATQYGKFSVTNKHNLSKFHITLSDNVVADTHKMKLFLSGLREGVGALEIDRSLVNSDDTEVRMRANLNRILGLSSQTSSPPTAEGAAAAATAATPVVSLRFQNTLNVFRNRKTGNIFISGLISTEGAQGKFFRDIGSVISGNKLSLGLGGVPKNPPRWHISIVVGEHRGTKISQVDEGSYSELLGPLELDDPAVLRDFRVNIDRVVANVLGSKRQDIEMKFPVSKP